jgi:DHA1 family bicyclomycin/chloramphenicol resistance-like MFS transporter
VAFTLLLGALGGLPPFAIDTVLPALLQIAAAMDSSAAAASLTLSTFMAGFAIAQLAFGPLSERIGRKPTLLIGCVLFTLASVLCALSPGIVFMLAARFAEGCGAGAGMVMVFAIVRDLFDGTAGRTKLSFVSLVIGVAPMLAPTLGAVILLAGDWRTIYAVLGLGGAVLVAAVWLGLDESLARCDPHALRAGRLFAGYREVLRHRVALPYILVNGLGFGCMFAYVTGSAFVLMQVQGLSTLEYGLAFAGTAASIMLGALVSGKLGQRHVPAAVPLTLGLALAVIGSTALLVLTLAGVSSFGVVYPLLLVSTCSYGLISPNASHGALQPLPHIAGVASASLGFVQMAGGSLAAALVAKGSDGKTALSMAGTMALCAGLAAAIYWWRIRPWERAVRALAPKAAE